MLPLGHEGLQFVFLTDLLLPLRYKGLYRLEDVEQLGRILLEGIENADYFGNVVFVLFF